MIYYHYLYFYLAHELTKRLADVREQGIVKGLGPDGKSQVSVLLYNAAHEPVEVTAIVLSTQHDEDKTLESVKSDMMKHVISKVIPSHLITEKLNISLTRQADLLSVDQLEIVV